MSDNLPTVWPAEPHTIAKHQILKEYLNAWMPILASQYRHRVIRYVDGFAGPGIYDKQEKGSPILAVEAATKHQLDFPVRVRFTFIEDDADRHEVLCAQIRARFEPPLRNAEIEPPRKGDCETILGQMLDQAGPDGFGPALVFLDQFGYSAVPMTLIARVLQNKSCEVFSYLAWKEMDRFIKDRHKHPGITRAFGCEDWRPAMEMEGPKRSRYLLDLYTRQLKTAGGARYVWPFAMLDDRNRLLYWLFFATNNLSGLKEMKKAMWKVDQTGYFSFSDKNGLDQLALLSSFDNDTLIEHLRKNLAGQRMTVDQLNEYVLTRTPAYRFRDALGQMERNKFLRVVKAPPGRSKGTFSDGEITVEFEPTHTFMF